MGDGENRDSQNKTIYPKSFDGVRADRENYRAKMSSKSGNLF